MATKAEEKVAKVMQEFESGTLKSSSGETVTSRKQALAIAMAEAGIARDTNTLCLAIVSKGLI